MLTREAYINSPVEIKEQLLHFFKRSDPLIIFDIGACEAEDSIRYSHLFPHSSIYAFEPRIDNCEKAAELIRQFKISNIQVENTALSNANGFADFYLSTGEPDELKNDEHWNYGNKSSSLLAPTDEIKKYTSWLSFKGTMKVKTQTLIDYVNEKNISHIDFMHIDVQGAESMVLEGCKDFIQNIKIIWTEVETVELYKGQSLKDDIHKYLGENNFINIHDTVKDETGDQLYVNKKYFSEATINSILPGEKMNFFAKLKSILKF